MKVIDKVRSLFAREAAIPPGGTLRDPGEGFRPLTASERDLTPLSQERMIEIAYWLMETNPMARAIIAKYRDFLSGEGIGWVADNDEIDRIIQKFWYDPVNQLEQKLPQKIRQLFGLGEQCYPAFVSEFAGDVRLGYVDPASIKEVITDPENCEVRIGVVLKSRGGKRGKRYRIIHDTDENIFSPAAARLRETFGDGDCFYFAVNNVSNAARGRSELLATSDSLDGYEQFIFDRIDMRSLVNSFIWDTTMKGLTQEQIEERKKNMPPPKRGMEFIHNEMVERKAVAPNMSADDATADARLIKNHILAAHGLPPTWFAEGSDVNRASAQEMDPAALKSLGMAQLIVKDMLRQIIRYQIRTKIAAGHVKRQVRKRDGEMIAAVDAFKIIAPEMSPKDMVKLGTALSQITTSLMIAQTQRWITRETAANVFANIAATLGMEIEPADISMSDGTEQITADYAQEARPARKSYA